jgi:uncharacterized membrane protein (UPF0127 family)
MAGLVGLERTDAVPAVALNETRSKPLATQLEVADNPYTRRKGLLGRNGLAPGEGLWIYPCESVHTFAMRFAIDLVYLDRNCVVKKLRSNVPPGRLSACLWARSVIELPAGTIEATGTEIGDRIAIQRLKPEGTVRGQAL